MIVYIATVRKKVINKRGVNFEFYFPSPIALMIALIYVVALINLDSTLSAVAPSFI